MRLLVTGGTGYVGRAVCGRLRKDSISVRIAGRSPAEPQEGVEIVGVGDISSQTDWSVALGNMSHVVHLAARVHDMNNISPDSLAAFRRVNTDGTANLARQAAAAGVKRFVYLSTVKVNGESSKLGQPFTVGDAPAPQGPYAISKQEAEQLLHQIAAETGMEVVIIRPPLVYGPGVKANFESMMRWLTRGVPLPLGAVRNNRRSLVSLDNLVDLLATCIDHPAAVNETFLVSDGVDLSTADLLRRLGNAIGKPARLLPVPPVLLRASAMLLGKGDMAQRLLGNLQVDISHTCETLGWKPRISVDEGLRRVAQGVNK